LSSSKLLLLTIVGGLLVSGQAADAVTRKPNHHADERLVMTVVLSRHGVRSPTWAPERLNRYSAAPWPTWQAQPGYLTDRGSQLLERFGSYNRATLAQHSLLSPEGCSDASSVYIWADTDQRTLESGKALAKGLFPTCPPGVHSQPGGGNDAIFHARDVAPTVQQTQQMQQDLQSRIPVAIAKADPLIDEMQQILQSCKPGAACTAARKPEHLLRETATAVSPGRGDRAVDLLGPLPLASSFSEDLLLEYADGMPDAQLGWGNIGPAEVKHFLDLHTIYFDLIHRTPSMAQLEATSMLRHIAMTLSQRATGTPSPDAVGPADAKVVYFVGHDTNLAGVASLLGVHWKLDGRDDDTPPGTQLVFQLWRVGRRYEIRIQVAMQTLEQMRHLEQLTLTSPPARQELTVPTCAPQHCNVEQFASLHP
jgi:4-phytase/acid phosphatase